VSSKLRLVHPTWESSAVTGEWHGWRAGRWRCYITSPL
jgi:hypothetical protein